VRPLLIRLVLTGAVLLFPACRSQTGDGGVVPIEQSPADRAEQPKLAPPDAEEPAAASCAEAQGTEAVISFNPTFPDPRCIIVGADQRLRIVNRLNKEIRVELGAVSVIVGPGFEGAIGPRFGDYLEPGVHLLEESAYEGDPEVWLR
jgi:hypothetical protein